MPATAPNIMARASSTPSSPTPQPSGWPCLRIVEATGKGAVGACMLDISVSPNAKSTELVGWHDGALRVRLAAPPVDGAANEALRRWLSEQLGVPQARITLVRGDTSRRKQWRIDQDPTLVTQWLARQPSLGQAGG
jgi:uncharacterized protein (TIGR00251 family)